MTQYGLTNLLLKERLANFFVINTLILPEGTSKGITADDVPELK